MNVECMSHDDVNFPFGQFLAVEMASNLMHLYAASNDFDLYLVADTAVDIICRTMHPTIGGNGNSWDTQ